MRYSRWTKVGVPLGGTFPSSTWKIRLSSKPVGIQSFFVLSVKWTMISRSLTSSLFPVSSSWINFPSNVINSPCLSCYLPWMRDEACRDPINKTQSQCRSSCLKSRSSAKMLVTFLMSAIFRNLPCKQSISSSALVLSLSVFKNKAYFILDLKLFEIRDRLKEQR